MRIGTGAADELLYRELGVLLGGGRVRLEHFDLLLELHDVGSERLTSRWERSSETCSGSDSGTGLGLHPQRRRKDRTACRQVKSMSHNCRELVFQVGRVRCNARRGGWGGQTIRTASPRCSVLCTVLYILVRVREGVQVRLFCVCKLKQ